MDAAVVGGLGVVGTATRRMLGISRYFDTANIGGISMDELLDTEYIFLCLPTPTVNGECDLFPIRRYFDILGSEHTYIIRSTVPPGTARGLADEFGTQVLSCPEFLTESLAHIECHLPDLIVFGGDEVVLRDEVWSHFFYRVRAERVVFTDTVTAEFIKYAVNAFYATKVVFANVLYDVAERLGVDYDVVREAMYARKWIGNNHLTVPWKGQRGLNGKCLPKDLAAFATFSGHEFFEFIGAMSETWTD